MGDYISKFMAWLQEVLLWIPRKLWAELLDGLSSLIAAIPVPSFVTDAAGAFSSISGNVLFFASKFAVPEGIAMILAAYALRFVIRRIPLIG